MIGSIAALVLAAAPGLATVSGRVTLGASRPAGDAVWVTRGGGCPATIPDDRVAALADGSLADVAVVLVGPGPAASPAAGPPAEVRGLYCALAPRVQVVPVGTLLAVSLAEGSGHRLHAYREGRSLWSGALVPGSVHALSQPEVIDVRCDAGHEWEVAWIYVTDAPYHAVTDRAGTFAIAGVPAGRYLLRAWHPYLGTIEAPVTVAPEAPSALTVAFAAREALEALYPSGNVEVER